MSHYRKVDVRIWNDAKFMGLSDDGKLTFMLLMTHPHQTMLGAMRATVASLADDLGWTSERLSKAFREACDKGMARHEQSTRLVWLPNFLKYNRPESPNVVKAWPAAYELLPECPMKSDIWRVSEGFVKGMSKSFVEAFESLPKDYAESGTGAGAGTGERQEPPYPPSQGGDGNLPVEITEARAIEPRDAPPKQVVIPAKRLVANRTAKEIHDRYVKPAKRQQTEDEVREIAEASMGNLSVNKYRAAFEGVLKGLKGHLFDTSLNLGNGRKGAHLADGAEEWRECFATAVISDYDTDEASGVPRLIVTSANPRATEAGLKKYRLRVEKGMQEYFGRIVQVTVRSEAA